MASLLSAITCCIWDKVLFSWATNFYTKQRSYCRLSAYSEMKKYLIFLHQITTGRLVILNVFWFSSFVIFLIHPDTSLLNDSSYFRVLYLQITFINYMKSFYLILDLIKKLISNRKGHKNSINLQFHCYQRAFIFFERKFQRKVWRILC